MIFICMVLGTVLLSSFAFNGCVAKSMHDESLAENIRLSAQLSEASKEVTNVKAELDAVKKKVSELETRNEELANTNQLLVSKNSEFARRSAESQQELIRTKQEQAKSDVKGDELAKVYDDLSKALRAESAANQLKILRRGDQVWVDIPEQVLFGTSRDRIQASGKQILSKLAKLFETDTVHRFGVVGHTDNGPMPKNLQKKYPSHWELSIAQATQVVRYLQSEGVDPDRLSAIGHGNRRPIAPNTTAAGRKLNRRTEVFVLQSSGAKR